MSDEPKRDRLGEVITDAVVRLREFNRMASQDCEPDDFSDADVYYGLREIADMQRKATALLRLAETCCKLTDYKFLSAMELLPALESRAEMLSAMSEQVIDVIPIMTTVIERLSEMVAELHADNTELRSLSRSLSASLRTGPRNTAT